MHFVNWEIWYYAKVCPPYIYMDRLGTYVGRYLVCR